MTIFWLEHLSFQTFVSAKLSKENELSLLLEIGCTYNFSPYESKISQQFYWNLYSKAEHCYEELSQTIGCFVIHVKTKH